MNRRHLIGLAICLGVAAAGTVLAIANRAPVAPRASPGPDRGQPSAAAPSRPHK